MTKGRHVSSDRRSEFARDAVIMGVGIVIVAALFYGILWLIQDLRSPGSVVAGTETTQTSPPTTTPPATTSTTQAPTTTPTTTAPTTTTTVVEVRAPEEITVLVLNSIGVTGLAGRVTEQLATLGYNTLEPDDYSPRLDQSLIWYKPTFGPEAIDLAANFPDALTELNADLDPDADIVVLLGDSYEDE